MLRVASRGSRSPQIRAITLFCLRRSIALYQISNRDIQRQSAAVPGRKCVGMVIVVRARNLDRPLRVHPTRLANRATVSPEPDWSRR